MTTGAPDSRDADVARMLANWSIVEDALREIIETPHWKVRGGKVVLDKDGNPVPDPGPARRAQRHLDAIARNKQRLTGGTP